MAVEYHVTALPPVVLVAAFCAVATLLGASWGGVAPVFLVRPPITRRTKGFFEIPHSHNCSQAVQEGSWTDWPLAVSCDRPGFATCGETVARRWAFSQRAGECGAARLGRKDIQGLLGGKWVVFAGDSITRMLYGAILRAAGSKGQVVKVKHQDFEYTFEGDIRATFLWRAYPSNLTSMFTEWQHNVTAVPDLVVSSASLWHLLWFTNATVFGEKLGALGQAAGGYLAAAGSRRPRLILGSTTETFTNRQPTERKRQHMTPQNVDAYNRALAERGVAGEAGPFTLLDLFPLTRECGEECSTDGIHSADFVYDTALQFILNMYRLWQT